MRQQFLIFLILLTVLTACQTDTSTPVPAATHTPEGVLPGANTEQIDFSQVNCVQRDNDPDGYLLAICEYVLANNINTSPADPSAINTLRIEEQEENGNSVLYIYLDCCGMGDRATIDAQTGEVLDYQLGDW